MKNFPYSNKSLMGSDTNTARWANEFVKVYLNNYLADQKN